jgi:hypothetical protein
MVRRYIAFLLVVYLQDLQEIVMYLHLAFKKRPPVKTFHFLPAAFSLWQTLITDNSAGRMPDAVKRYGDGKKPD